MFYFIRLYTFHALMRVATWVMPRRLSMIQVLEDGDSWGLGSIWLITPEEYDRLSIHDHRPKWMMKDCPSRVFEF